MVTGAEKRSAKRAAKQAAYRNPKVADKEASFCLRHGWYILMAVNVTFGVRAMLPAVFVSLQTMLRALLSLLEPLS